MAYAYCRKCDAGLDDPTFEEAVNEVIICHCCGHDHQLGHNERNEAIIRLEERICAIEQQLGITL